jgi:NADH-quinone oxidoreductase subunit C
MQSSDIVNLLKEKFSKEILCTVYFRGDCTIIIKRDKAKEILKFLKETPSLDFDYLIDVTGVDYMGARQPRFNVVYHLMSIKNANRIRVKVEVPEEDCWVETVSDLWATANWHERECFDMFGIEFKGHPDLRRILMPEDWEGYPLRKDYPVGSDLGDKEWKPFKDILEQTKERA